MALVKFSLKYEQMSTISEVQIIFVSFWRPETWTDFAVVHDSPSIGAGPSIALFMKLKDVESLGKVVSQRAAIKWVTRQLLSKFLCFFMFMQLDGVKSYT